MKNHDPKVRQYRSSETDFHGAAIIDEQGREIPITEQMVQQACSALDNAWQYPAARQISYQRA